MSLLAAALALALPASPSRAIELPLGDSHAERGAVGFIDMQRLFADSPDAARAKESFEAVVRSAEERVNLSKAELLKMRQELAASKAAREALVKSVATPPLAPAASSSTATPLAAPPGAVATPSLLPGLTASRSTTTAPSSLLPGMTASTTPLSSPAFISSRTAAAFAPSISKVSPSTSTASTASAAPAAAAEPLTVTQQVLELDGKIIAQQAEILRKEAALTRERGDVDKGLIDIESRKTDQVLARLYRVISEVARQEGVSIVVDKSAILYGHQGVDLTDKVLKALRSSSP